MIYAIHRETKEHRVVPRPDVLSNADWYSVYADADGWISWSVGGECPLQRGTLIDVKHRSGDVFTENCDVFHSEDWNHLGEDGDIVAYRPVICTGTAEQENPDPEQCGVESYKKAWTEYYKEDQSNKSVKWDGTGLPPLGAVCQTVWGEQAHIVAHHVNGCAIWSKRPDGGQLFYGTAGDFKPLKTDREKWIDDALDAIKQDYSISTTSPQDCVENAVVQLYDAIQNGDISAPKPKDQRQEWELVT